MVIEVKIYIKELVVMEKIFGNLQLSLYCLMSLLNNHAERLRAKDSKAIG